MQLQAASLVVAIVSIVVALSEVEVEALSISRDIPFLIREAEIAPKEHQSL